jgi:hypothetical protein
MKSEPGSSVVVLRPVSCGMCRTWACLDGSIWHRVIDLDAWLTQSSPMRAMMVSATS